MALKIRLSRIGTTHAPVYHVVVAEARSRRDGRPTENLGTYNPRAAGEQLTLKVDRADYWLSQGAKPTDTALSLIKKARKAAETIKAAPVEVAAAPVEIAAVVPDAPAQA
jgi:small subunit ribosomal protein S16